MKYKEVCEAFKKCGVLVDQHGVTLVFNKYSPTRWIMQSVDEEFGNISVFQSLLREANEITLSLYPNRYVGFLFGFELPVDTQYIFMPMQGELTAEEYKQLILMNPPDEPERAEAFREFLSHADLSNTENLINGFQDFLDEQSRGKILHMSRMARWKKIEPVARCFSKCSKFGFSDFTPPDKDIEFGIIDFHFSVDRNADFKIKKECMPGFREMVSLSTGLSLEAIVKETDASFTFSVFA